MTRSSSPASYKATNSASFCTPGSAKIVSTPWRRNISTSAPPPVILVITSLAAIISSFRRKRESSGSSSCPAALDPRLRGGDERVSGCRTLLESVSVSGAVTHDPADRGRGEMRRQQTGAARSMFLDQPCPRLARQFRIGAGERRPFRLQELQRMVDHIAHENTRLVARAGMDHDIARRVAGRALKPQPVLERVVIVDQHRLSGAHDRQHAVLESEPMGRVFAVPMHPLPMRKLAAGHDVARIGKGRGPAPVFEPGIPADMIPVQMSAHHIVDTLHTDPGAGEIGDIGGAQPVELRPGRTLLVVAEARIDQDRMMTGLDDEAMKAEEEVAGRRVDQPGAGVIGVRLHHLLVEIGKKRLGGNKGPLILGDAMNLEIPDTRDLHLPLRTCAGAPTPAHPTVSAAGRREPSPLSVLA